MLVPADFLKRHGQQFPAWDLEESRRYTRALTQAHYENFAVTSILVPRSLRQDYCNVYAFCRWADDLGDEAGEPGERVKLLEWWRAELRAVWRGQAHHPVYVALRDTVERHALGIRDFDDLIRAFIQDQSLSRYESYDDLLAYCRYSANPVGRLVLRLHGKRGREVLELSDSICTGLQLANHWQDIRRDWQIGRVYVPEEVMAAHGYSHARLAEDMAARVASRECRATIRDLTERARAHFQRGLPLAELLGGRLGLEVELFARAGLTVLQKIEAQRWDTISSRPVVGKRERTRIAMTAVAARFGGRPFETHAASVLSMAGSYAYCRSVARSRARNFYYSFALLPRGRRDAMCAVYAFMRRSDDIADDTSVPRDIRYREMHAWRATVQAVLAGGSSTDPVLIAFRDTVRRFAIPHSCFFEVLDGVEQDLQDPVYRTFDDLYSYCYKVASAVGIATIHILGFKREAAVRLAEKCGVAFQLTNIMRDVAADSRMGRVYFPSTELEEFGLTRESLLRLDFKSCDHRFQRFMAFQWKRADRYYRDASGLLPLLDPAGRIAFWTLVATYRGLLEQIRKSRFAVLERRVRLPVWSKLWLVGRALHLRAKGGIPPYPA